MSEELFAAVVGGDVETIRTLVREDPALASARDGTGLPVVLLALFNRRFDAAEALLDAGPDARRERTPEGFTPLGLAAFLGGPDVTRVLLDHGADADDDADNQFGIRPVNAAAAARDHETMRLLLEAGADPDAAQQGGFTPLHQAAHTDDEAMAWLLLEHGADPGVATADGRDSARIAADDGSAAVAALLARHGSGD